MDSLHLNDKQPNSNNALKEGPSIDLLSLSQGQVWHPKALSNKIIFITSGALAITYDKPPSESMPKGSIILLPAKSAFNSYAEEDTKLIIIHLHYQPESNELLLYNELFKGILNERHDTSNTSSSLKEKLDEERYFLTIHKSLWPYLENLGERIKDGLKSNTFFELKLQELFLLLRAYYSKEELSRFFSPMQYCEQSFYSIIINNFENAKTVKELAQLTNYSVSGFEKKFKRVFNTSAGNWLKQQKSTIIFNDISNGSDSFKNISYQNGFSSISHFNNYCKLHFSKTPGEIRRAGKKEN